MLLSRNQISFDYTLRHSHGVKNRHLVTYSPSDQVDVRTVHRTGTRDEGTKLWREKESQVRRITRGAQGGLGAHSLLLAAGRSNATQNAKIME